MHLSVWLCCEHLQPVIVLDTSSRRFLPHLFCFSLEQLIALIAAAKQHDVEFIYAISPGLDITFSSPREVAALTRKLDQVGAYAKLKGDHLLSAV